MPLREYYKQLDHLAIYFLIAGTYTPVMLIGVLKSNAGDASITAKRYAYPILAIEWACAIAGVSTKLFFGVEAVPEYVSNLFYLFMGWVGVLGVGPIMRCVPSVTLFWLALGGMSYSLGVIWLIFEQFHFNHAIWHLHVLFGSLCHFVCVLLLLVPLPDSVKDVKSIWVVMRGRAPATLPIIVDFFCTFWRADTKGTTSTTSKTTTTDNKPHHL